MSAAASGNWRRQIYILLLLVVLLYVSGWSGGLDRYVQDIGARILQHKVDSDLVLIDIDAKSLRQLDVWPWPRRYHAELLERLATHQPDRVFFDIDFSNRTRPADDQAFARALQDWPHERVILAAFLQFTDASRQQVVANYPLAELSRHADLASINLFPAVDGLVRTVSRLSWSHPPETAPLASVLSNRIATDRQPLLIDYAIDPRSFQHISYVDVVQGRVEPASLRGKKIIIGAAALELRDQIAVPLHQVMNGPLVQALAYESVRQGGLSRLPAGATIALLTLLTLVTIVLMERRPDLFRLWRLLTALAVVLAATLAVRAMADVLIDVAPYLVFMTVAYVIRRGADLDADGIRYLAQKILLNRQQHQLDTINANTGEGIVTVDSSGTIVAVNPACAAIFDAAQERLLGSRLEDLLPELGPLDRVIDSGKQRVETQARRLNGVRFPAEVLAKHLESSGREDGAILMVLVRDVSAMRHQEELLSYQETHDLLTRLYNRQGYLSAIDQDIQVDPLERRVLMVVGIMSMTDINHELGHAAGDELLKFMAALLTEMRTHRESMQVARVAGDQFAIWLKGDESRARSCAVQLGRAFENPIRVRGIAIDVRLSIGMSVYPTHADNVAELLRLASVAMKAAEESNSLLEIYMEDGKSVTKRKLVLASQLRDAIQRSELTVHYQPKLDLRTNQINSVEALLRWQHPEFGFIPPDEFIRVAEDAGVISQLTEWVIRKVIEQQALWLGLGVRIGVAVNISSKLLRGPGLLDMLDAAALTTPKLHGWLVLEITESAIMDDKAEAMALLNILASRGYRLSLDDFGTGHSSFAYLKDLPVQELKVDKCFVMDMFANKKDAEIVFSIISMAHRLGLEVVAEGVETTEIQDMLAAQQCEFGQGYGIGRPMPAAAISALFLERNPARSAAS